MNILEVELLKEPWSPKWIVEINRNLPIKFDSCDLPFKVNVCPAFCNLTEVVLGKIGNGFENEFRAFILTAVSSYRKITETPHIAMESYSFICHFIYSFIYI